MKRSYKIRLVQAFFIFLTFVIFDLALNFTLYNPSFITPIYDFFIHKHLISVEATGYPLTSILELNRGLYSGPRAAVIGTVSEVLKSEDGDWHINVQNSQGTLVVEIIPEHPLVVPLVGDKVRVWGVTRYDIAHRWWELHPVIGIKKLSQ